jgi:hypothetical protein
MEPGYESRGENPSSQDAAADNSDGQAPLTEWEGYSSEILDGLLDT